MSNTPTPFGKITGDHHPDEATIQGPHRCWKDERIELLLLETRLLKKRLEELEES